MRDVDLRPLLARMRYTMGEGEIMKERMRALYAEHRRAVRGWVRALGVAERDADDVTHDIFIKAMESLGRYDPSRSIKPWLKTIAYRHVRDRSELRSAGERPWGDIELVVLAEETVADLFDKAEEQAIFAGAVARTDAPLREVIKRILDEEPHETIAAELGVSLPTVQSMARRGRAQLATRLRALGMAA